jgi:hypothetical protein
MAVGSISANGVWIYGEDDPASPFSGLLNLGMQSVSDRIGVLAARVPARLTSDAGFPVATASTAAEQVVHNRISVPAAAYPRVLVVTCTMHLTYTQTGTVDTYLYIGAATLDQVRVAATASVLTPVKLSGQVAVAASAAAVIEARFARQSGTGVITPALSTLSRMVVTVLPA